MPPCVAVMASGVRETLTHPAGRSAIATIIGYLIILAIMTIVLFGGAWFAFGIFG